MAAVPYHFEYPIKDRDTLSSILQTIYGVSQSDPQYSRYLQYLLALNPHIKNPDRIRAGDVLRLNEPLVEEAHKGNDPPPHIVNTPLISEGVKSADAAGFQAVTWMADNSNSFLIPGSVIASGGANLLSSGNVSLIHQMSDHYASYKSGNLTKGQYDYRRALALRRFQTNIGPMDRLLFGNGGSQQSLRIARAGGVPANANLARHASRLQRLGQVANKGGVVLTGVGLSASCIQIANTTSQNEKNQIFVESVAGSVTGLVGGAAVGLFLVSNPVGWGTALLLAAGTAAWGYNAGKASRWAYDRWGNSADLVSATHISQICH